MFLLRFHFCSYNEQLSSHYFNKMSHLSRCKFSRSLHTTLVENNITGRRPTDESFFQLSFFCLCVLFLLEMHPYALYIMYKQHTRKLFCASYRNNFKLPYSHSLPNLLTVELEVRRVCREIELTERKNERES